MLFVAWASTEAVLLSSSSARLNDRPPAARRKKPSGCTWRPPDAVRGVRLDGGGAVVELQRQIERPPSRRQAEETVRLHVAASGCCSWRAPRRRRCCCRAPAPD